MNWSKIEVNHVKPISSFDVSKDGELRESFNWQNTQPFLKEEHQHKGTKFVFLAYCLQFIKADQLLKKIYRDLVRTFMDLGYFSRPGRIYPTNTILHDHTKHGLLIWLPWSTTTLQTIKELYTFSSSLIILLKIHGVYD